MHYFVLVRQIQILMKYIGICVYVYNCWKMKEVRIFQHESELSQFGDSCIPFKHKKPDHKFKKQFQPHFLD